MWEWISQVLCSASKRFYDCVISAATVYVDCHSSNVVYLIICNKCYMWERAKTNWKI